MQIIHAEAGRAAKHVAERIDHHEAQGEEQRVPRRDLRLEKNSEDYHLGRTESQGTPGR